MNKDQLIRIFQDTVNLTKYIDNKSVTTKHKFDDIVNVPTIKKSGTILVEPTDTITTVQNNQNGRICMLNMASYKKAGGGVDRGTVAQEECLFRCTNLYHTIVQEFYPLESYEGLYTKDAIIIKDKDYGTIDPYITVDCVTVAAINLQNSKKDDDWMISGDSNWEVVSNYENNMKMKIRLMLSLAYKSGVDTLVLGAWGCGVYRNDPNEISQYFYDVLVTEGKRYMFEKVIFGIINDDNSVDNNYEIFYNRLKNV